MSRSVILLLGISAWFAGCARTSTQLRREYVGPRLPRPSRIIVQPFAVRPGDVQPDSSLIHAWRLQLEGVSTAADEQRTAAAVANRVAEQIVDRLRDQGLPAERAVGTPRGASSDSIIVIAGQFVQMDEGQWTKRVLIGFGLGAAELTTHIEVYHLLATRRELVRELVVTAKTSRKPGAAATFGAGAAAGQVAIAAGTSSAAGAVAERLSGDLNAMAVATGNEIAKQLRPFFEEQGWLR